MRTEMATERVAQRIGKFEWSLQTNAHVTAHPTTRNKYLFYILIQIRMHKYVTNTQETKLNSMQAAESISTVFNVFCLCTSK